METQRIAVYFSARSRRSPNKFKPHTVHGENVNRGMWISFQFLAEFKSMVVNGAAVNIGLKARNSLEQLSARDNEIGILNQRLEGFELACCEGYSLAISRYLRFGEVHYNVVKADWIDWLEAVGVAQGHVETRQQFAWTKGFGHVVVGPQL